MHPTPCYAPSAGRSDCPEPATARRSGTPPSAPADSRSASQAAYNTKEYPAYLFVYSS